MYVAAWYNHSHIVQILLADGRTDATKYRKEGGRHNWTPISWAEHYKNGVMQDQLQAHMAIVSTAPPVGTPVIVYRAESNTDTTGQSP